MEFYFIEKLQSPVYQTSSRSKLEIACFYFHKWIYDFMNVKIKIKVVLWIFYLRFHEYFKIKLYFCLKSSKSSLLFSIQIYRKSSLNNEKPIREAKMLSLGGYQCQIWWTIFSLFLLYCLSCIKLTPTIFVLIHGHGCDTKMKMKLVSKLYWSIILRVGFFLLIYGFSYGVISIKLFKEKFKEKGKTKKLMSWSLC